MSQQAPLILTAPMTPLYIRMAMPIIFGLMINGLFNFIDAIFISRAVGNDAIGGVSAAFPIQMIMISLSAMLGSGMASIISRYLGANKDEDASLVFNASLVLAGILGFIFSVLIVSFRYQIFHILKLPDELIVHAVDYLTPIAAIGIISFCQGSMSECLRAQGLNVQVFKLMASMAILNIILDAVFLFIFDWGVSGAAWATAISITAAFFYATYLLNTGNHRITFNRLHFRFVSSIHKEAVALGIPVFLSYTGFAMMLLIVNIALVEFGEEHAKLLISAHGILNRTFMLIFLPILGMMIAFQTIAGFNYGASRHQRVTQVLKIALIISSGYAMIWSIIMILGSRYLFQLFSQDILLIEGAAQIAEIVFIGFITTGVVMICPALFQALGFARPAGVLNALHNYVFLLPVLWLLASLFGVKGIWWSFPVIDGITTVIISAYTLWSLNKQLLPKLSAKNMIG